MRVQSVLIDGNLLLDVLLERYSGMESMEFIWKQISLGHIKGYVTSIALQRILCDAYHLTQDEEAAEQLIRQLLNVLECCQVDRTMMRRASELNLRFSAAIQIVCGLDWQVDGILTSNPLDFCLARDEGIKVFTPGFLVVNHLNRSFENAQTTREKPVVVEGNDGVSHDLVVVSNRSLSGTSSWRLEQLEVSCGDSEPKATVVMQTPIGKILRTTAIGNGPIDAVYKAIKKFFDECGVPDHRLVHTDTQATTADSAVSVTILLQVGDSLFPGRGFHTDTVRAYVYAYIDAIEYMRQCNVG